MSQFPGRLRAIRTRGALLAPPVSLDARDAAMNADKLAESEAVAAARAQVRALLSERALFLRRVERDGLRRSVLACALLLGVAFVRHRFSAG